MERGRAELRLSDFAVVQATFSDLIAYCPDYAEGYDQRAFAHFLGGNFAAALPDLEAEAQQVLRKALKLNPWLPERAFLAPIPGRDL